MRRRWLSLCLPAAVLVPGAAAAQTAGTLITADPVVDTPAGMQAWRVAYWTSGPEGRPSQVTGMIVAPREALPRRPRDVIAWAHGTWGVSESCAPSRSANFYAATPALAEMVRAGYVVVAPDYPGLGSAPPHPYLVGEDTARSVLDAVRAAQAIPGAASGTRFAVWGESQGGHAALWTGMRARGYAPDLTLVGVAAAAPPTELAANFRSSTDANARAILTAFTAYSWSQRFGAPLASLFNRTNQGVVTRLGRNVCVELGKAPRLGTILGIASVKAALKGKDITRIAPWTALMRANSVNSTAIFGPLLIAQGSSDTLVAPAVTRTFARRACRDRRPVRYLALPGVDHARSARDSSGETLAWIADRFAGKTAPSDCGKI